MTRYVVLALLLAACSESTGPDPIPEVLPPDMPRVELAKAAPERGAGGSGGGAGGYGMGGGQCTSPSDSAECLARFLGLVGTAGVMAGSDCGAVALCGALLAGWGWQVQGYLDAPDTPGGGDRLANGLRDWAAGTPTETGAVR